MKKTFDWFDPTSKEFLMAEYVFKGLFVLRERLAQKLDVNPDKIADARTLYMLSKIRPTTKSTVETVVREELMTVSQTLRDVSENFAIRIQQRIDDFPLKETKLRNFYEQQPFQGVNT